MCRASPGYLRQHHESGVKIPQEISLIGFDDMVTHRIQSFQVRIILADALEQVNGEQGSLSMDGDKGVAVVGLH